MDVMARGGGGGVEGAFGLAPLLPQPSNSETQGQHHGLVRRSSLQGWAIARGGGGGRDW